MTGSKKYSLLNKKLCRKALQQNGSKGDRVQDLKTREMNESIQIMSKLD